MCLTNLADFYGGLTALVDIGKATDVIYVDLCKAFDMVLHYALLDWRNTGLKPGWAQKVDTHEQNESTRPSVRCCSGSGQSSLDRQLWWEVPCCYSSPVFSLTKGLWSFSGLCLGRECLQSTRLFAVGKLTKGAGCVPIQTLWCCC